jgi:hypothetical protein
VASSYIASGNTGIGTTTPWGTLSVEQIAGQTPLKPIFVVGDNGTSSPFMFVSQKGNVGVGTPAPITQFHVAGAVPKGATGSISTGASTNPITIYVQGRYAYVGDEISNDLQIFDISNPASPSSISSIPTDGNPESVYVQGRYAYVANGSASTLQIFDISNPASPTSVSSISTGLNPRSVYVQGRYAYEVNYSGNSLQVFDVSNPKSPSLVGSAPGDGVDGLYSVYVQGRYAYVVNQATATLQVYDVSNPMNPSNVGSVSTDLVPYSIYVQGRYAYVANGGASTLQIFDIFNPAAIPPSVGSIATDGAPWSVYVQGRYAYVANGSASTLQIFDISNPANPLNVGSVATDGAPMSVYVQGRYAYAVNCISNILQIFDVGGAYIQQLEAGGIETGTLATRSNLHVGNDADISGGLTVGNGGIFSSGGLGVTGTSSFMSYLGIGTSTPWGELSVDQLPGQGPLKPTFVVADNGTSSPFMFVSQKGVVGFGTSSPTNLLLNPGDVAIGRNSGLTSDLYVSGGLGVGNATTSDGDFAVGNNFVVFSNGAVGIGTSSPDRSASGTFRPRITSRGGLRIYSDMAGATGDELADIAVDDAGTLSIDTTNGKYAGGGYITITPKNAYYGVLIGDGAGAGILAYLNTFVVDSASGDYVNWIVSGNPSDTTGLVLTDSETVGVGTTSPWGQLSVDQMANQGRLKPIFVVGDNGTSSPFIFVSQKGVVSFGSSTPSTVLLNPGDVVVGRSNPGGASLTADMYISGGLGIGGATTSDNSLEINTGLRSGLGSGNGPFVNIYSNNRIAIGTTTSGYAMMNLSATSSYDGSRRYGQILADTVNQRFNYYAEEFWYELLADATADSANLGNHYLYIAVEEQIAANGCTWSIVNDTINGIWRTGEGSGGGSCLSFQSAAASGSDTNLTFNVANNVIFETYLKPSAAADADGETTVGLGVQTAGFQSIPSADGIYFANCSAAGTCGANWFGVVCTSGGCNFLTTNKAVKTATYQRLRFETHAGHVDFYINDNYVGKLTVTTPTGNMTWQINFSATSDTLDVDYVRIWQDDPGDSQVAVNSPPQKTLEMKQLLTAGSDLAELYPIANGMHDYDIDPGTLLSIATSSKVLPTTSTYQENMIGVVSTNPGQTLGANDGRDDFVKISLTGRVPVKISLEGGPVREGDQLTSSSIPGYAMRARIPNKRTAGMALESFDGTQGDIIIKNLPDGTPIATGEVLMFVNLGWSHFDSEFANGTSTPWIVDAETGQLTTSLALNLGGQSIENVKSIASASGNWSIDENGNLIVKSIKTHDLEVEGSGVTIHDTSDNAPYCVQVVNGSLTTTPGSCTPTLPLSSSGEVGAPTDNVGVDNATTPVQPEGLNNTPTLPTPTSASDISNGGVGTPALPSGRPTSPDASVGAEPTVEPSVPTPPSEPPPAEVTPPDTGTGAVTQEPPPPTLDPPQA